MTGRPAASSIRAAGIETRAATPSDVNAERAIVSRSDTYTRYGDALRRAGWFFLPLLRLDKFTAWEAGDLCLPRRAEQRRKDNRNSMNFAG